MGFSQVLGRVKEQKNILRTVTGRKANWFCHTLRTNCLLKHVIEGKIERRIEVTGRRGGRRTELLHDLQEKTGYWKLKRAALHPTACRTHFGRGCGPVLRLRTE